jgi:hypothetical protein
MKAMRTYALAQRNRQRFATHAHNKLKTLYESSVFARQFLMQSVT